MEFIVENYIWFIVGGLILMMAVVGYIADVTDFGRKKFDSKNKEQSKTLSDENTKKSKNKKENTELPVEETSLSIEPNQEETPVENVNFDFPMEQVNNTDTQIDELQPMTMENDLFADVNENEDLTEEPVDQSLFEPLPGMEQTTEENDVPLDTPLVENNDSEIKSDDDIWKF